MTDQNETPEVSLEDLIPDLETQAVRDVVKKQGGASSNCIPWTDLGQWICALKQWQFKASTKGGPPYFEAKAKVLSSTHPSWPAGTECSFIFKLPREGTPKQPNLPEKAKAKVNRFIRCLAKVPHDADGFSENALSEKLRKAGPLDTDAFQFKFTRKQGNAFERAKMKDGKVERDADGQPIIETGHYANDYYDAVEATAGQAGG